MQVSHYRQQMHVALHVALTCPTLKRLKITEVLVVHFISLLGRPER